jgi:hypothetical protein
MEVVAAAAETESRPLLRIQYLINKGPPKPLFYKLICHNCKCFLGGHNTSLKVLPKEGVNVEGVNKDGVKTVPKVLRQEHNFSLKTCKLGTPSPHTQHHTHHIAKLPAPSGVVLN